MKRDLVVDRLFANAHSQPDAPALHGRHSGGWRPISWREYADRCLDFAGALIEEGHAPGEAVAIMGNNRPEWLIADVGAMVARGVPAGIYQTSSPDQATYIAGHCEAKVLVLENPSYYPRIQQEKLPHLWRIVLMEGMVQDPLAMSFEAFCAMGRAHRADVERRIRALAPEDPATLIYTSGTTGPPKAALLSAGNLAFLSRTAVSVLDATPADCTVSYLPLAHVAEQMLSIHVPITGGYPVWFAESLDKLKDALLAARPTIFLGVPRVWEKFHAALSTKLAAATGVKAKIIAWSRATGMRSGELRLTTGEPGGLRARLADRLFASKLQRKLGLDRLRVALSGAAPIGREVLDFFLSCGITIHETYGMTESTAVSTFNSPGVGMTRFGTVGRVIDGVEVKLAEDGEILMRGPNVFLGYYKDPQATRDALIDGWLHSGDIGVFDDDGFLRITDRKKDLLITSSGKNISPQNIERHLKAVEGIAQAVAIGDRKSYLTALLTLDPEKAPALARARGWPEDLVQLAQHPGFLQHVREGVDHCNAQLSRIESVRRFTVLPADFSLEAGELTPTQKIKRKVVHDRYAPLIAKMYDDAAGPQASAGEPTRT